MVTVFTISIFGSHAISRFWDDKAEGKVKGTAEAPALDPYDFDDKLEKAKNTQAHIHMDEWIYTHVMTEDSKLKD